MELFFLYLVDFKIIIMVFFLLAVIFFFVAFFSAIVKPSKTLKEIRLQHNGNLDNFNPFALIIDTQTTGSIDDNSIMVTKKNVSENSNNFPRIVQISYMLIDIKGNYEGESFYIKQIKKRKLSNNCL